MNESQPKIKILVACHKSDPSIRQNDIYMPVHVGKALHPDINLGFPGDDTGDNISDKNSSFCELTALYWAWKNLKGLDYIGLCHYRRYFDFTNHGMVPVRNMKTGDFQSVDLRDDMLLRQLSPNQVIMSRRKYNPASLFHDYGCYHNSEDLRTVFTIIQELYPEDAEPIKHHILNENALSPFNMFVMSWQEFDRYCQWLFTILFEAERRIDISTYPAYQKRIFGFLGERLMDAYFHTRGNLKVKHLPVIHVNDSATPESAAVYLINRMRFGITHALIRPPKLN